jgi:hypothetical protein
MQCLERCMHFDASNIFKHFYHLPGPSSQLKQAACHQSEKTRTTHRRFFLRSHLRRRKHRVELMHLGVAHTHGDALAWLPQQRILFTGDVCVNSPYNFVREADVGQWVGTLDAAKRLGARMVCTAHGVHRAWATRGHVDVGRPAGVSSKRCASRSRRNSRGRRPSKQRRKSRRCVRPGRNLPR